jgi:hypothetical protein
MLFFRWIQSQELHKFFRSQSGDVRDTVGVCESDDRLIDAHPHRPPAERDLHRRHGHAIRLPQSREHHYGVRLSNQLGPPRAEEGVGYQLAALTGVVGDLPRVLGSRTAGGLSSPLATSLSCTPRGRGGFGISGA